MKYYAKAQVLQPSYMKSFSCIGGACEDNCCHGRTDIDRDTFEAFKALPNMPLKKLYFENIAVNGGDNPYRYASMRTGAEESCPFLNDRGLCSIQAELGEAYLSCVCYSVPRRVNYIGGVFESSLRLVCPEACRVALLHEPVMEFDSFVSDVNMKTHIVTEMNANRAEEIQPAWFSIRSAFIDMLQDRRFDVGHRLFLAGLAAEGIDKMNLRGASAREIEAFLQNMAQEYSADGLAAELGRMRGADAALYAKLVDMSKFIAHTLNMKDDAYRAYIGRFLGSLNGDGMPENALLHIRAAEKIDSYFESRQHIPEHWFVNLLFSRCFPMRNRESLMEEYTKLVLYFFLMKSILAGIASSNGGMDDAILVDFIHRLDKLLELETGFEEMIDNLIANEKLANINAIMAMTIYRQ